MCGNCKPTLQDFGEDFNSRARKTHFKSHLSIWDFRLYSGQPVIPTGMAIILLKPALSAERLAPHDLLLGDVLRRQAREREACVAD